MGNRFLSAEWRNLVMLNYETDPAVLRPLIPRGTELDSWNGRHLVSVVGFLFRDTRVMGLPIPFHRNFEEINLRFYVRREGREGWRRGVVFVKEIVPRLFIALVARWLYNENYVRFPMSSRIRLPEEGEEGSAQYSWVTGSRENSLKAIIRGTPRLPAPGSEEEFVTEHYWGYVSQRDGSTVEYEVRHPQWRVWRGSSGKLDCDTTSVYGQKFEPALRGEPGSAFVAEGSPVEVFKGRRLQFAGDQ